MTRSLSTMAFYLNTLSSIACLIHRVLFKLGEVLFVDYQLDCPCVSAICSCMTFEIVRKGQTFPALDTH